MTPRHIRLGFPFALLLVALLIQHPTAVLSARARPQEVDHAPATLPIITAQPDGPIIAAAVTSDTIYIGGQFNSVGGVPRKNLAAFSRTTGQLTDWAPIPFGSSDRIWTLTVNDGVVYIGGEFFLMNNMRRPLLAAVDAVTGAVLPFAPDVFGNSVRSIIVTSTTVFIGGPFRAVTTPSFFNRSRNGLAAIDRASGELMAWNPSTAPFDGTGAAVETMYLAGETLYIGGTFHEMGGQPRRNFAALDVTSGTVLPIAPDPNAGVQQVVVDNGKIYLSGIFTMVGGVARAYLAELDQATGAVTSWDARIRPQASGETPGVTAVLIDDVHVYFSGLFGQVGGQPLGLYAAADRETATPVALRTGLGGSPRRMAIVGNQLYLFGSFRTSDQRFVGITTVSLAALTGEPSNILPPSATLNASIHPAGLETTVAFEVTTTSGAYDQAVIVPATPATLATNRLTRVSARLTRLPAGVYYYRVVTTSSAGVERGTEQIVDTRYTSALPFVRQ
jgi:hypothetical protein